MSKKPPCFQDPEIFEEDHPDCIDCDFYGACKVLVKRKLKVNTKEQRTREKTLGSTKSKNAIVGRAEHNHAPTVDYPGMGFLDKLIWNTIRETGSTVFGEVHRAWDESVPRVRYTSILKHLEAPDPVNKNDSAEENNEDD